MKNFCNLFAILKQGILKKRIKVKVHNSKFNINLLELLYKHGFIRFFKISDDKRSIFVFLKYVFGKSIIQEIILTSKPSKRCFMKNIELVTLSKEKNIFGIVSTDKGLMSLNNAVLENKGGELLCLLD